VSGSGKVIATLLAVLLAGCATHQNIEEAQHSRWPAEEPPAAPTAPEVPAPKPVAPAPVAPPVAQAPTAAKPAPPVETVPSQVTGVAPTNRATETWVPLNRWCQVSGLRAPARLNGAPVPTYAITSTNGVLVLRPWSHVAHWNGLELRLGFSPQLIDGQPFVHALDIEKNIRPLVAADPGFIPRGRSETSSEGETAPVVVIDPGHGGENAGTKSVLGPYYEKEFTLDWARRLRALLVSHGWQVFLTRTNDNDLALSNRVAVADAHHARLFLSLHFNSSAPNETQAGLETYCLTPQGMPSTVTREFEDDSHLMFPNNAFDELNLKLALQLHRALLQANGNRDRGVRRARYLGVLRGQQRPAVLLEGGYLSNPREARLIADPAYREKMAEALAKALVAGMECPPHKPLATGQPARQASQREQANKANRSDSTPHAADAVQLTERSSAGKPTVGRAKPTAAAKPGSIP
jgi:N-acetylmuramoyl-L-alanine amidase